MEKYKLINKTTGTETLCEKVTIDGFDYYVNSDKPKNNDDIIYKNGDTYHFASFREGYYDRYNYYKKVIATNNPAIDVPKVVDEVEELSEKFIGCKYEDIEDSIDQIGYDSFKRGYNKSQETHPFSEEDMIEFGEWCENLQKDNKEIRRNNPSITTKELLQIWKEQRPKIVYYG